MTSYYHRSESLSLLIISHNISKSLQLIVLLAGLLLVSSCEEDPTFIGRNILPKTDNVSVSSIDTFRIISYTRYDYPVRTQSQSTPFIGTYYDPYFGTTRSEFISQLRLEQEFSKGNYDVDSVKLVLRIVSAKGSTDIVKQLRITEISKMLHPDSAYYSNTTVDTTQFGISIDIPKLRTDSINVVEMNLPVSFGEYMIRDQEKLFYSTSAEDFRTFFKGIYMRVLSTSPSDPLLLGLDVTAASYLGAYTDYIIVYMHSRDDNNVRYNFRFLLDPIKENARFSRIEHDFSTAVPDKKFHDIINKPETDTLSYLQGLNGVYTKLIIPGLEVMKNNPARKLTAINKATLYIPVNYDGDIYTASKIPDNLLLRYVNKSGVKEMIPDYYIDTYHEYFGGKLDTASNSYRFNISNFIQNYFNDKDGILKPELEVFQSSAEVKNVILKANASKKPLRLEMVQTEF